MTRIQQRLLGIGLGLGLMAWGSVGFTAPTHSAPIPSAFTVSMPAATAPYSAWQSWASAEQTWVQAQNWTTILSSQVPSGSLLHSWAITPTVSPGGVIPAGITTDGITAIEAPTADSTTGFQHTNLAGVSGTRQ